MKQSLPNLILRVVLVLPGLAAASRPVAGQEKPSEATRELYRTKCALCHLPDGNSPVPDMNFANGEWKHGTKVEDMVKTIREGVPGTAMLAFKEQLSPAQMKSLAVYVRSFDKTPAGSKKQTATEKREKGSQ
jgi:mono/diheme cytochrome c family protein